MFLRCGFADAEAGLDVASYAVLGLPFDCTASFRSGSRDGPNAIRRASFNFESYNSFYDIDLSEVPICDLGDLDLGADPDYADETILDGISLLPESVVPVFLGGEHSVTPSIVRGLKDRAPGRLSVLVLDAHLDLRDEYGCTRHSHACASRRILEHVGVTDYASIGIRSGSREEFEFARENRLSFFTAQEVRARGIDDVLDRALKGSERLYISIDLDALDPAFAPAVGNPEPFGLTSWDVQRVIQRTAPLAVGLDVVELTPAYDHGQSALLASRLVREFIAAKAASGLSLSSRSRLS